MIACLATMRTGRPLTGILFFNNDLCDLYDEVFPEFPSPYGDFVFQLLDQVKENRKLTETDELVSVTREELLNGAKDWQQYSEGGCSLVYDEDICRRLCSPSMQKKKDYGCLMPNSRETWIDVQARALSFAARRFIRLVNRTSKRGE